MDRLTVRVIVVAPSFMIKRCSSDPLLESWKSIVEFVRGDFLEIVWKKIPPWRGWKNTLHGFAISRNGGGKFDSAWKIQEENNWGRGGRGGGRREGGIAMGIGHVGRWEAGKWARLRPRCNNNNAAIALTIARTVMTAMIKPRHGTNLESRVEEQEQSTTIFDPIFAWISRRPFLRQVRFAPFFSHLRIRRRRRRRKRSSFKKERILL